MNSIFTRISVRKYKNKPVEEDKIRMLMDFTSRPGDVSDPWYTGDFKTAYRDIYEGCEGLLSALSE